MGDYRTAWDFTSDSDLEKKWVTTADSYWGEGYSTCALDLRENGRTAMFHGELNTRPPNDGREVNVEDIDIILLGSNGSFILHVRRPHWLHLRKSHKYVCNCVTLCRLVRR